MAESIRTALSAEDQLGRYRVVRRIGAGAMGSVYEAEHVDLGKRVALKALLPHLEESEEVRLRMLREGKAASAIRHPHVVDVTDVGVVDGVTFLVMELLEGEDLGRRLKDRGALTVEETADILVPVIAGLAAAHAAGVLHRDLKPANIFLTRGPYGEEVPKLVDFGIAKDLTLSEAKPLTETGRVIGTPYYMSPEQVTAARDIDARSDVYSMGVIIYHCLCGRTPFRGSSLYTVMSDVVRGAFESIDTLRPDLPSELRRLVMQAMATEPADRCGSVAELGGRLAEFASTGVRDRWRPLLGSAREAPAARVTESSPAEDLADQTGQMSVNLDDPLDPPPVKTGIPLLPVALGVALLLAGAGWFFTRPTSTVAPQTPVAAEPPRAPTAVPVAEPAPEPEKASAPPPASLESLERTAPVRPAAKRSPPRPKPVTREVGEAMRMEEKTPKKVAPKPKPPAKEGAEVELGTNDAPILH